MKLATLSTIFCVLSSWALQIQSALQLNFTRLLYTVAEENAHNIEVGLSMPLFNLSICDLTSD